MSPVKDALVGIKTRHIWKGFRMKEFSAVIKVFGLLWLIVAAIAMIFAYVISRVVGIGFGTMAIIMLLVSIPLAACILAVWNKKLNLKPIVVLHKKMMDEVKANGYSDEFFRIAEEGIKLNDGSASDFVYFKDFAIYGAEGLLYRDDYAKSLQYLNMIDLKEIKAKDIAFIDGGRSVITFFVVQMEYCKETGDVARSENVMRDAKQFLNRFDQKSDDLNVFIDDIYCLYYFMNGDYEESRHYAEKMIDNPLHQKGKLMLGQCNLMYIYHKLGDDAKVREYYDEAVRITNETNSKLNYQILDKAKKDLI